MVDADMEDYGFEYSDEEPEEQDVDIENQYYNTKGRCWSATLLEQLNVEVEAQLTYSGFLFIRNTSWWLHIILAVIIYLAPYQVWIGHRISGGRSWRST